jgi:hypothetical protein
VPFMMKSSHVLTMTAALPAVAGGAFSSRSIMIDEVDFEQKVTRPDMTSVHQVHQETILVNGRAIMHHASALTDDACAMCFRRGDLKRPEGGGPSMPEMNKLWVIFLWDS